MHNVTHNIEIAASRDAVWAVLGNIGDIANYNPNLQASAYLGEVRGDGASRRCVITDQVSLDERIVAWEEGHHYTLELYDATTFLPYARLLVSFEVSETAGDRTRVVQTMSYRMKGGPVGNLLAPMMRGTMSRAVHDNLEGLKRHVEAA
jgi:uncharacterized membrane protein